MNLKDKNTEFLVKYSLKIQNFAKWLNFAKYLSNKVHTLPNVRTRGCSAGEKMQNEMLKVDSAESSAQEGHTYAILQGVGQGAVLRLAQGRQLLPKKTRSTTPPFSHGAEIVYGCNTQIVTK